MENSAIRVVVQFNAKPDKVEELIKVATTLAEATHKEDGCAGYEFMQNRKDPTDIVLVENWRDKAALAAHAETDHFKKGMAAIPALVTAEPQIRFYKQFA